MKINHITTRYKSGVYIIKNIVTGRCYIGSSRNMYDRLHAHRVHLIKHESSWCKKYHKHFPKLILEDYLLYGIQTFECAVLEYCSNDRLLTVEQTWLDKLSPGYNTIDARAILRPDDLKKRISDGVRKAYSEGRLDVMNRVPVLCYDLKNNFIQEFPSTFAGAKWMGVKPNKKGKYPSHITSVCRGSRRSTYGYIWKYKNAECSV